jgi:hypothetical protein
MIPGRICWSNLLKIGEMGWNGGLCIVLKGFSEKNIFWPKGIFFIWVYQVMFFYMGLSSYVCLNPIDPMK